MATPNSTPPPPQKIIPVWLRHGLAVVFSFTLLFTAAASVTYLNTSQWLLIAATPVGGLTTAERHAAVKKILAFYATGDQHLLAGYTADEQAHLIEVAGVIKNGWRLFFTLLLTTLAGFGFIARRSGFPAICGQLRHACGFSAVGSLLILLVGWVGFDFFFERFHQLIFSAAPWTFDPSVSRLVNEFPPEYFQFSFVLILGATAAVSVGLFTWLRRK